VIVTRGLGLPREGNLAVAGFGLVPLVSDGASRGGYAFPRPKQFRPPKRQLPKSLYDNDDEAIAIALALALLT
jgi:hypothetical protein